MDTIISIITLIVTMVVGYYAIRSSKVTIDGKVNKSDVNGSHNQKIDIKLFLTSRYILVPLLAISAFLFGALVKQLYFSNYTNNDIKKTRIVVMMPMIEKQKSGYKDGFSQLNGFAEYINKNDEKYDYYDFVPLNHNNDPTLAKEIIIREIKQGTNYFISTMSKVDVQLSKEWPSILKSCNIDTNKRIPKLICTVASSTKIITVNNSIYRFYIRSKEECKALVDKAKRKDLVRAFFIVDVGPYGEDALKEYESNFQGGESESLKQTKIIYLNDNYLYPEIKDKIENELGVFNPTQNDAIFIAHFGSGIDNIFKALYELKINSVVFANSRLSMQDIQEPLRNELQNMNWYTCFPEYNTPQSAIYDDTKNDVIKNFVTYTISGLIFTLDKMRNDPKSSFHDNWQGAFGDMDFKVTKEGNDYIIPLRVVGKDFFKK